MSVEKLPKVIRMLQVDGSASPSKIATEIKSDRRTVKKILGVALELGLAKCQTLQISRRTYAIWCLTSNYKRILEKIKG